MPLEAIDKGLEALIPDDAVRAMVSRKIDRHLAFLGWNASGESGFFAFDQKVEQVLSHFERDGLAHDIYVAAAVKEPRLFYQQPATIVSHIEGVIERFAGDGLARKAYLDAACKHPPLFTSKPLTIIGNVERVLEHFADDGLMRKAYLDAACKQPSILGKKPKSVIRSIESVLRHFADDGLTRKAYLDAACKQPSLFAMNPATVIGNVEGVLNEFAQDGLHRAEYLAEASKRPALFVMKPATVIGHVNLVTNLCRHGLLDLPGVTRGPPTDTARVLSLMMKDTALLCMADDNIVLRELYAVITAASPSPSLLRRSRKEVEYELARALGHSSPTSPLSKANPESGRGQFAINLLMRALVREGFIKGQLE